MSLLILAVTLAEYNNQDEHIGPNSKYYNHLFLKHSNIILKEGQRVHWLNNCEYSNQDEHASPYDNYKS